MSAEDYTVVIPSYKRPEGCRDKTLAVLHKYNIPKEKIFAKNDWILNFIIVFKISILS